MDLPVFMYPLRYLVFGNSQDKYLDSKQNYIAKKVIKMGEEKGN